MNFQFGIDALLQDSKKIEYLKTKKVALLAHPASVTSDMQHSMRELHRFGVPLQAGFGPQHGIYGEMQYNMQETQDLMDPKLKIPIFSLYGEVRRPTPEMMSHFDVLLVDLQDVGTRIYTFLTTLLYVLEECTKFKKEIWVLDRPNPAGRVVEGSLLEPGWTSFVGCAEDLPMRHGLTLGEFANYFKNRFKFDVDLNVIQMKNYDIHSKPGFGWPNRSWVNPSPNITTAFAAKIYPGTVMLEGTHLSEGRGTTRPLELVGAPDIDAEKILAKMHEILEKAKRDWLDDCRLRLCYFMPTFYKHKDQMCSGIQFHIDDTRYYHHDKFKSYRLMILFLKALKLLYPNYQLWRDFHYEYEKDRLAIDLINGGPFVRQWIDDPSSTIEELDLRFTQDEKRWAQQRQEFLIY